MLVGFGDGSAAQLVRLAAQDLSVGDRDSLALCMKGKRREFSSTALLRRICPVTLAVGCIPPGCTRDELIDTPRVRSASGQTCVEGPAVPKVYMRNCSCNKLVNLINQITNLSLLKRQSQSVLT